ncbi:MAG: DUF4476 domain-containing protein [Bacillota bacterium]
MILKSELIQKLDVIGTRYISELSFKDQEKARVMLSEITKLVEKVVFQNEFNNQDRKEEISRKQFMKLLDILTQEESFVKQKNMLVMTSLQKKFTVDQVYRILHCISDIDNKFTVLELLVPNIANPKDSYTLFEYVKNLELKQDD